MTSVSPQNPIGDPGTMLATAMDDLQRRIRNRESCPSENVLKAFPNLAANKESALELIYFELVLREEIGQKVSSDEFLDRFPAWREDLRELLHVHDHVSGFEEQGPSQNESPGTGHGSMAHGLGDEPHRIGKYEILRKIGTGGAGTVYKAKHATLGRIVALKTINRENLVQPNSHVRFRGEAESAARLQHPNITQVFEVGLHEGWPYLTMEYAQGGNLATLIRRRPLPALTAAKLLEPLARAVDYAHQQNVVHRDLKPANILLAPSDRSTSVELLDVEIDPADSIKGIRFEPKITDFGLAKRLDSDSLRTVPGATLGTPSYMAPEQADTELENVGPSSDIYALGAVLYDMLVGRPPFHAASVVETLQQVKHSDPVSPRSIQSDVPRDLETICLKCLQKEPARRYSTANELADDVLRFIEGRPIQARPVRTSERFFKWIKRHPAAAALLAFLILGTIGIASQWYRAEVNRIEAENQSKLLASAESKERAERERVETTLYAHDVALAHHEAQSNNTTRALQLLNETPQHLRGWEWDYLFQHSQMELRDFDDFELPLRTVDISPNGRWVASAPLIWGINHESSVRIWDVAKGQVLHNLDGQLTLFDATSGTKIKELIGNQSNVLDVAWHPDGELIASAGRDGTLRVWNANTGEPLDSVTGLNDVRAVDFSPDKKHVAICTFGGRVKVFEWGANGLSEVYSHAESNRLTALQFSPDGQYLALPITDSGIQIVDWTSGATIQNLKGHNGAPSAVAFNALGNLLASAGIDGRVKIWNLHAQENPRRIAIGGPFIEEQVAHPNGRHIIAASAFNSTMGSSTKDPAIRIWDIESGLVVERKRGHTDWITSVAVDSKGNTIASAGDDSTIILWDENSSQPTKILRGHEGSVRDIAFANADQQLLSAGADGTVRLWRCSDGTELRRWDFRGSGFAGIAVRPNSQFAVVAEKNGLTRTLNMETQSWTGETTVNAPVTSIAMSPNGAQVVVASSLATIEVWLTEDLAAGRSKPNLILHGHTEGVSSVAFNRTGNRIASSSFDRSIKLWDSKSGQETLSLPARNVEGRSQVIFDANDQNLVSSFIYYFENWTIGDRRNDALVAQLEDSSDAVARWHEQQTQRAMASENWTGAVFHLDSLLESHPDDARWLALRATALSCLGDWERAVSDHLSISARTIHLDYELGLCYLKTGKDEAFNQLCQRLIEQAPTETHLGNLNSIAWICSVTPRANVDRSIPVRLAEQVIERDRHPDYLNTLSAAYFRAGMFEKALASCEESLAKRGTEPAPFDWLIESLTLSGLGRNEEARESYSKARSWYARQQRLKSQYLPTNSFGWAEQLELHMLLDECKTQLNPVE